jgi:hypothetical protein
MFKAKVTLWRWPGRSRASKSFSVRAGKLEKSSPKFLNGVASTVTVTVGDIARRALEDAPLSAVMLYAVAKEVTAGTKYVLAARDTCERANWYAPNIAPDAPPDTPVLCRSDFAFHRPAGEPGYILIDCDRKGLSLETVLGMLYEVCPELRLAPIVAFPSGSGFVGLEGTEPGPGGWHIVVGVADTGDAERAIGILFERCFLVAGAHWAEVADSGAIIPKAIVDRALRTPTQPHFYQRPTLGAGIIRHAPEPVILNPENPGIDTRVALRDLGPDELARIGAARTLAEIGCEALAVEVRERRAREKAQEALEAGAVTDMATALDEARKAISGELRGMLDWGTKIHFDRFGWISPDEMFEDPERFHKATCADPVEPNYGGIGGRPGRNKAIVHIAQGRAVITSLAHSSGVKGRTFILDPAIHAFSVGDFPGADAAEAFGDMSSAFRPIGEPDLTDVGIKGARSLSATEAFMHNGLPDCDLGTASVVFSSRRRSLLALAEDPSFPGPQGLRLKTVIDRSLASGKDVAAIVYGGAGQALADAVAASAGAEVTARVDIYAENKVAGAFPVIKRSDGCLRKKALKAVQEFAPRSTGSILCKSASTECPHFGECPVILSLVAAQRQALVQFPAYAAGTDPNALLNETAGTVGVFADPRAAVDVVTIPVSDMAASTVDAIRDAGLALLNPTMEPQDALTLLNPDVNALKGLAKAHGVAAGPSDTEEDITRAVETAKAHNATTPVHVMAGVLFDYFTGHRDVVVKLDKRLGHLAMFVATPAIKRARHHQVAVAFHPMPVNAVDTHATALAVFQSPALVIPGGAPDIGPVAQCFDAWSGVLPDDKRVNVALNLAHALKGAGITPAVVTAHGTTGARGIEVRHPLDNIGDPDLVIWADHLTASDMDVAKLMRMSGEALKPFHARAPKLLRWTTVEGRVLAAAGFRPDVESVYRAWQHAAWAPVITALSGKRAGVLVLSDVPCPWPVHALVGIDDVVVEGTAQSTFLAARILGIKGAVSVSREAPAILERTGDVLRASGVEELKALADKSATRVASYDRAAETINALRKGKKNGE